jgi:hypothetical protein
MNAMASELSFSELNSSTQRFVKKDIEANYMTQDLFSILYKEKVN